MEDKERIEKLEALVGKLAKKLEEFEELYKEDEELRVLIHTRLENNYGVVAAHLYIPGHKEPIEFGHIYARQDTCDNWLTDRMILLVLHGVIQTLQTIDTPKGFIYVKNEEDNRLLDQDIISGRHYEDEADVDTLQTLLWDIESSFITLGLTPMPEYPRDLDDKYQLVERETETLVKKVKDAYASSKWSSNDPSVKRNTD